jgi:hypothetical protein
MHDCRKIDDFSVVPHFVVTANGISEHEYSNAMVEQELRRKLSHQPCRLVGQLAVRDGEI